MICLLTNIPCRPFKHAGQQASCGYFCISQSSYYATCGWIEQDRFRGKSDTLVATQYHQTMGLAEYLTRWSVTMGRMTHIFCDTPRAWLKRYIQHMMGSSHAKVPPHLYPCPQFVCACWGTSCTAAGSRISGWGTAFARRVFLREPLCRRAAHTVLMCSTIKNQIVKLPLSKTRYYGCFPRAWIYFRGRFRPEQPSWRGHTP